MPLLPGQSDVAWVYISLPETSNDADCMAVEEVDDIAADVVGVPDVVVLADEELADEAADLIKRNQQCQCTMAWSQR